MLGFSLSKIVVLAAIVVAVWYGFKFIGRLDKRRKEEAVAAQRAERAERAPEVDGGDMVKCPRCDAYVVATGAMDCGRPACPY